MYSHSLPSLEGIVGTFKFTLYSTEDLTVPTIQTIKVVGDLEASIDSGVLQHSIPQLNLSLREDHSQYTQGFWWRTLKNPTWLFITLDEGDGDTYYFYGKVSLLQTVWKESYVNGMEYIRTASVVLDSYESIILSSSVQDFVDELIVTSERIDNNNASWAAGDGYKGMPWTSVFATLMHSSGINSDYLASDCTYSARGYDAGIRYTNDGGATQHYFDELWFMTQYYLAAYPTDTAPYIAYINGGTAWYETYNEAGPLLSDLLSTFQLIATFSADMTVNDSGGKPRCTITLTPRRNAYADLLTLGKFEESTITLSESKVITSFSSDNPALAGAEKAWASQAYRGLTIQTDAVPGNVTIEKSFNHLFGLYAAAGITSIDYKVWVPSTASPVRILHDDFCTSGQFYKHSPVVGFTDATAAVPYRMAELIVLYNMNIYTLLKQQVVRLYGSFQAQEGAVTAHTVFAPLKRAYLDLDGDGDVVYFIRRVIKKPSEDRVEVEWVEE
jgi:hypothetical protein